MPNTGRGKMAETIWIIAGESSGDAYGAELAQELRRQRPELSIRGMGGIQMRQMGVDCFVDSTELGIVGFIEVLKKLPFFLRLLKEIASRAKKERPDAVVLIDYPGFNLRLAEKLHKLGIPVVWFISPQVWAWKKGRIPRLAACVDRMLCIFPFEPKVYEGSGLDARFVGHPLLEVLSTYRRTEERDPNRVVLLPGSRTGEIQRLLPVFLKAAVLMQEQNPLLHFHLPLAREKNLFQAEEIINGMDLPQTLRSSLSLCVGYAREEMALGAAGMAASGTVTVEAAILGMPVAVSYKMGWLNWQIAKRLVKLPSITIANLVTGKTVFEEKLQDDATPEALAQATMAILPGGARRSLVMEGIRDCVEKLGGDRRASENVAQQVLEVAKLV
ncbi:MAG: lipid-A-disaccharide synthase [Victivallales bacterium]|nr:lipid-A-disaccharide synthase [Victivallales bacterium]